MTATVDDLLLHFEIQQALFDEARLLDEMRFQEWLAWVSEDVRYWMPLRVVRKATETGIEYGRQGDDVGYFDDDHASLSMRVKKYGHTMSWSDNPAARVVRAVTNVQVERLDDGTVAVRSVLVVHRARFAQQNDTWNVARHDVLEPGTSGWRLRRREVLAPESVLRSSNLDVLF
ncbi:3-phenylpropionate/cinnamic acid dioxygenase subunit beta [Pseudonocardia kongjuensis]|uniref:3-phenylpropionate/cinnamic acid dioxygenase subunit beta n=2 Tax=Pseudonocardia kongjuensis TaxID=102227 RepID=A0ABN1XKG7_9PSEU